jgi:hypothetical protein
MSIAKRLIELEWNGVEWNGILTTTVPTTNVPIDETMYYIITIIFVVFFASRCFHKIPIIS